MLGRVIPKTIEATEKDARSARIQYSRLTDDVTRIRRDLKNRKVSDPVAARAVIAMKERQQKQLLKWMRDHYVVNKPSKPTTHRPPVLKPRPRPPMRGSIQERLIVKRNRIYEPAVRPPSTPSIPISPRDIIDKIKPKSPVPEVRLKPTPVIIPPSKAPAVVNNNAQKAAAAAELAKKKAHEERQAAENAKRQAEERALAEKKVAEAKAKEAEALRQMQEQKAMQEKALALRKQAAVAKEVTVKTVKEHAARAKVNLAPIVTPKMAVRLGSATQGMQAWQKHHELKPQRRKANILRENLVQLDREISEGKKYGATDVYLELLKVTRSDLTNAITQYESGIGPSQEVTMQRLEQEFMARYEPMMQKAKQQAQADHARMVKEQNLQQLRGLPRALQARKTNVPNYSYRQLRARQTPEEMARAAGKAIDNAEAESAQLAGMFPRLREATQRMVGR